MRSSWITQAGPKSKDKYLTKEKTREVFETHRGKSHAKQKQRLELHSHKSGDMWGTGCWNSFTRKDSPLEGVTPQFGPEAFRTMREHLSFLSHQVVTLCFNIHGKPIELPN